MVYIATVVYCSDVYVLCLEALRISTDGLPRPLFYMAGLLCWNYFAECMNRCSDTFNANQNVSEKCISRG